MKTLILVLSLAMSGCSSIDLKGHLENRVTTTLSCDRGFFASLWGPIGFTSEIDAKDVTVLCKDRTPK